MDKAELVYRAKLAEHADRYNQMVEYMRTLANSHAVDFGIEERTLLSVAYKQAVGERRTAWRALTSNEEKQRAKGSPHLGLITDYKQKVNAELHALCLEVISLIDSKLLQPSDPNDVKVFYLKMKGDYYRYMAEAEDETAVDKSLQAYNSASEVAEGIEAYNPVRLGLALNFSVFHYEVMKNPERACSLARSAFDNALQGIDELDERSYKEATSILGLIKDNLTLWSSEES